MKTSVVIDLMRTMSSTISLRWGTISESSVPDSPHRAKEKREAIQKQIKELNAKLPPLTEFVIPGGERAATLAHVCRTICRRAERHSWGVPDATAPAVYLNRLSDLFFIMARLINTDVTAEEAQWRGLKR